MAIDYYNIGGAPEIVMADTIQSMAMSLSMMAVSSSAGILIGVLSPSVLLGAILVIYGANQISALPILPTFLLLTNPVFYTIILGLVVSCALLTIAILFFNRKQF